MAQRIVTKDEIRALQRVLADRGLYAGDIDGLWGDKSSNAVRRVQEDLGHDVTGLPTLELLIELDVITPPAPRKRNPISDFFTDLLVRKGVEIITSHLKGLPMFSGYKTYATAIVLAVMAGYSLLFGDLPLVGHVDPGSALMALLGSLGLGFARVGAKTEAKKVSGE